MRNSLCLHLLVSEGWNAKGVLGSRVYTHLNNQLYRGLTQAMNGLPESTRSELLVRACQADGIGLYHAILDVGGTTCDAARTSGCADPTMTCDTSGSPSQWIWADRPRVAGDPMPANLLLTVLVGLLVIGAHAGWTQSAFLGAFILPLCAWVDRDADDDETENMAMAAAGVGVCACVACSAIWSPGSGLPL
jgi:hypothetical protein